MTVRDLVLMTVFTLLAVAGSLMLLRSFAPGLLGMPQDLELVQLSEKVPPFYENVFRADDFRDGTFILKDPMTRVRAQPLLGGQPNLGPHDILGFRNTAVPAVADVVVIGDSQTYGTNVPLPANWPGQMARLPALRDVRTYNVSVGGWGAVQYYDMFRNVTLLRPRVIVVAFYSGNDPLDSFIMAYGNPLWSAFKPDEALDATDAPRVVFPPPQDEHWPVRFADGSQTVFTPSLRLAANRDHPAVDAGWDIMVRTVREMRAAAGELPLHLLVTVIPTKETVFAPRVTAEGLAMPADYRELIQHEATRIAEFANRVRAIPDVTYVDVIGRLQAAASSDTGIYAATFDGHPRSGGHRVIGQAVGAAVALRLPPRPADGLYAVDHGDEGHVFFTLQDGRRYFFRDGPPPPSAGVRSTRATLMAADEAARYPVAGFAPAAR